MGVFFSLFSDDERTRTLRDEFVKKHGISERPTWMPKESKSQRYDTRWFGGNRSKKRRNKSSKTHRRIRSFGNNR